MSECRAEAIIRAVAFASLSKLWGGSSSYSTRQLLCGFALYDIIFDFDLTEKKILSSSKFEEKFGWTLNIQNYNKNFLNEFALSYHKTIFLVTI